MTNSFNEKAHKIANQLVAEYAIKCRPGFDKAIEILEEQLELQERTIKDEILNKIKQLPDTNGSCVESEVKLLNSDDVESILK